jgi:flavin-binding protein dodecin
MDLFIFIMAINFIINNNLLYQEKYIPIGMAHVAKIIEIIGGSEKGWEAAAQVAIDEARKTIHGITGIEVVDMTAKVDPTTSKITQYRACVKIAFGIEHS